MTLAPWKSSPAYLITASFGIPGPAFGMTDGCYFRVAYGALQKATVAEGIGRLVGGLRAIL